MRTTEEPRADVADGPVDCPYIGLAPFDPAHQPYFFGRDDDAQLIASHVVSGGITVLQGASGVGKSSVLGAALPKALEELAPGSLLVSFRRWDSGFYDCLCSEAATQVDDAVARAAVPAGDSEAADARGAEARGAEAAAAADAPGGAGGPASERGDLLSLCALAEKWSRVPDCPPLVFVFDQFEQYFTGQDYGTAGGDKRFEADLARIVRRRDLGAHVLISIRADAYYELNRLRPCVPDIFTRSVLLEYLDADAAREAITGPLLRWGAEGRDGPVEAEPDLVDALLGQLEQRSGSNQIETPYLQLALTRLWRREREGGSRTLRKETLLALGGATGIVRVHFAEVMNGLASDEERSLCAAMFARLVTPSGMKIALTPGDLAKMLEVDPGKVEAVLEKLGSGPSRIIHRVQPPQGAPARFEIFHDVLARPILEWVATEEERAHHARELAATELKLARARREKRRYAALALLACAALVVVLGTAGLAVVKHREARAQRGRMLATQAERRLELGDQRTALLLVLEALPAHSRGALDTIWNWLNWPDEGYALDVLDRALGTPIPREIRPGGERVTFAGFDPNGGMVTGTDGGAVDLWPADAVAKLAAGGDPGGVARTHLEPADQARPAGITSVGFDRDGRHMVTADQNGLVAFWNVGAPRPAVAWSVGSQTRVATAISPGGTRVATVAVGDRMPRLWAIEPESGGSVAAVEVSVPWRATHRKGISSVGFDPEGRRLVTTSFGGAAAVWDIASGRLLQTVRQEGGGIFMARFSPDGRRLVTGGWDGSARIWNLSSPGVQAECGEACFVEDGRHTEPDLVLDHDGTPVFAASFDASGREIVTTSLDGAVRIWSAETGSLLRQIDGPPPPPGGRWAASASLSRDGRRLIASTGQESLLLWQLYGPADPPRVRRIPEGLVAIAASPDGTRVAIASQTGLDIGGSGCPSPRQVDLDVPPLAVAVSPAGRVALALGDRVRLLSCDVTEGDDELAMKGSLVLSVAYDPAGEQLVTATQDGSVRLWSAEGEPEGELLSTPGDPATALAFGQDGRLIYAGSAQGHIHVVDVASRRPVSGPELSQPGRAVLALGFAPGGRYLVASTVGQNDGIPAVPVILDTSPSRDTAPPAGNLSRYLSALQAANVLALAAPGGDGGGPASAADAVADAGADPGHVVVVPVERMLRPGAVPPPPEDTFGRIGYAAGRLAELPERDRSLSVDERCGYGLKLTSCPPQGGSASRSMVSPADASSAVPTSRPATHPVSMTTAAGPS